MGGNTTDNFVNGKVLNYDKEFFLLKVKHKVDRDSKEQV